MSDDQLRKLKADFDTLTMQHKAQSWTVWNLQRLIDLLFDALATIERGKDPKSKEPLTIDEARRLAREACELHRDIIARRAGEGVTVSADYVEIDPTVNLPFYRRF